ncbi:hypothetical protein ZWY2020_030214 [Hordeum vulgare]|nr:hypothetical protein ZWY2020_030214 [Hordeum vulgare]
MGALPAALAEPWLPSHEWAWESVAAPTAPFDGNEETVVSTRCTRTGTPYSSRRKQEWRPAGTYSFDTKRREWRSHGNGCAFHRAGLLRKEIDAWVGPRGRLHLLLPGRHGHAGAAPEWRKTEQKLYREGDRDRRLGATLTYMGNNVFCLVESVVRRMSILARLRRRPRLRAPCHRVWPQHRLATNEFTSPSRIEEMASASGVRSSRQAAAQAPHLVLDDWDNGSSLHKMDALSSLDDSDDDGGRELEQPP